MKIGVCIPAADGDGGGTAPGWPVIASFCRTAEALGFDSLWMYDHYFYLPEDGGPLEGQHEAWTLMSAAAAITERVEIGALVMCVSFREPGLLAKMAATLDDVSGGRLILGLGAGWHDPEYEAFGWPLDHRVGRFEEALQIIVPLLDGRRVTFEGDYYRVRDAVLAPPPARRIPVLIASEGPRMLRLTARFADSWNSAWFGTPDDDLAREMANMDAALDDEGRDRSALSRTVGVNVAGDGATWMLEEGQAALRGPAEAIAEAFAAYEELGIEHLMLALDPATEATLEHIAGALRLLGSRG